MLMNGFEMKSFEMCRLMNLFTTFHGILTFKVIEKVSEKKRKIHRALFSKNVSIFLDKTFRIEIGAEN